MDIYIVSILHQFIFTIVKHHDYEDFILDIFMFRHFKMDISILYVLISIRIYPQLKLLNHLSFVLGISFFLLILTIFYQYISFYINRNIPSFIRYQALLLFYLGADINDVVSILILILVCSQLRLFIFNHIHIDQNMCVTYSVTLDICERLFYYFFDIDDNHII